MNSDLGPFEEQLKSLQPRPLSPQVADRIRRRLRPPRWLRWLAVGAATASLACWLVWAFFRQPHAPSGDTAPAPSTLLLTCQYEGVVPLAPEGPYRQTRYRIRQAGGETEVIVLQKASVD